MKDAIIWKRILNEGIFCVLQRHSDTECDAKEKAIADAVLKSTILVDTREGDLGGVMEWEKFQIVLPFPRFWVEGHLEGGGRWGALVESSVMPSGAPFKWLMQSTLFAQNAVIAMTGVGVLSDGRLALDEEKCLLISSCMSRALVEMVGEEEAKNNVFTSLWFAFDFLQLLTCKNVSLEPRDNDPKQVRRAVKRHGGNADKYRYHVLVVKPPGARSDAKGVEIGIMPRHVCRGHFSEYGPEFGKGLLFGRYAGRFFIPPHLKGDKKNGEVAKDYAVA